MMDALNTTTVWILLAMLIVAGIIDTWQTIYSPPGSSLSATTLRIAREYPVLPYLIGVLCGHLLWPQR